MLAAMLALWVLLPDDFNFYHETTVSIVSIVTEQTLQTGPAFTACQTATNLELSRAERKCHNFTVTPTASL